MKVGINKQLILEAGHIILEAVHSNHSYLDKSKLKDPNTSYAEGKQIADNRKELADNIKEFRKKSSIYKLPYHDNRAREISQTGKIYARPNEQLSLGDTRYFKMIDSNPRMVQSARK